MLGSVLLIAQVASGAALWPGSPYSAADRDEAIRRGIAYLRSVAENPRYFAENGEDLLWCFYTMSVVPADPRIRKEAGAVARKLALNWRRLHPSLPERATPDDLVNYATAGYAANRLGVRTPGLRERMRLAAARFTVKDFLGFPASEGPPSADRAGVSRYDIWCDALITAQAGELFRVTLGAPYPEVIRWLPTMRPYPTHAAGGHDFYPAIYAATHAVYTVNNYNEFAVDRDCLRPEWEYLKANVDEMIRLEDAETVGELLDCLRAFGESYNDPVFRRGAAFLLSKQNADGSWGDPHDGSIYNRYHSTWTAIDGLMEYRFRPARPCPVP